MSLASRIRTRLARYRYAPHIQVTPATGLMRLGSSYGGWTFDASRDLERSTIISCGLGEDASFDVEFAARFHARVILVDPTPRAIQHFAALKARLGEPKLVPYAKGGKQPAEAYDLTQLDENNLTLVPVAIWVENGPLRFYAPRNPEHVSHSIVNLQNNYSADDPHIEVPGITPEDLVKKLDLGTVSLVKLDIEGAEISVIPHMLQHSIRPAQLLVEFDEMLFPSQRSRLNAESTDALLQRAGYTCRHFDGLSNFLYTAE
jgi:FkbM family methyltransferase